MCGGITFFCDFSSVIFCKLVKIQKYILTKLIYFVYFNYKVQNNIKYEWSSFNCIYNGINVIKFCSSPK